MRAASTVILYATSGSLQLVPTLAVHVPDTTTVSVSRDKENPLAVGSTLNRLNAANIAIITEKCPHIHDSVWHSRGCKGCFISLDRVTAQYSRPSSLSLSAAY